MQCAEIQDGGHAIIKNLSPHNLKKCNQEESFSCVGPLHENTSSWLHMLAAHVLCMSNSEKNIQDLKAIQSAKICLLITQNVISI